MNLEQTLLEPLNRLQKLTEASLKQHGKLNIFSKALQEQTIGVKSSQVIRFSYCSDCFRTAMDTVFSRGVLSGEEAEAVLPFVRAMAKFLKPIIPSFAGFERASVQECQQFFSLYKADSNAFGYANEQTKWAGAHLAQKATSATGDAEVSDVYKRLIESVRHAFMLGSTQVSHTPASKLISRYDPRESFWLDGSVMPKMARSWEITEQAAKSLAQSGKNIFLVSLRRLPESVAEVLATSKANYLCLDSVEDLSDKAIATVSKFEGDCLSLGLLELSESQAKALSNYSGQRLALNGLSSISPEAMSHLVKMKHILTFELNGLVEISDNAAYELANFGCNLLKPAYLFIELCSLETLSIVLAKTLKKINCGFDLNSVRELSIEAASIIASRKKNNSQIRLEGLDKMSVEVATTLASTDNRQIYINVSRLSLEVIEILKNSDLNLTTDESWYEEEEEEEDDDDDDDDDDVVEDIDKDEYEDED